MKTKLNDPLLAAARIVILLLIGLTVAVGLAVLVAIPAMFVYSDTITVEAANEGVKLTGPIMATLAVLLAMVVAGAAIIFWFLRDMLRIVDTVGEGDPFIPQNAFRLQRMGWLALGFQGLAIALGAVAAWLESAFDEEIGISFDISVLLLALVLFILARVFRHGAAMREDLEGTV